ncbi:MAG: cupredoxin domain-containing protein [Actinomycetes bacterium]
MTRRTVLPLLLAVALATGGCASGDNAPEAATTASAPATSTPQSSGTTPGSPSSSATPDRVNGTEVVVAVKDGKVSPKPHRVKISMGTRVRLLVTSDVDDQVHVHGYELEKELPAGQTVTVKFVADQAGLYEVETHDSELTLLQLEVR